MTLALEIGVWHNGLPFKPAMVHTVAGQFSERIAIDTGSEWWTLGFEWDGEPFTNWLAFRAVLMRNNDWVTPMIPGMVFRHPWGVYSTTQLPAQPRQPLAGFFTLGLRVVGKLTDTLTDIAEIPE